MRYLDPSIDIVFKLLFASEENRHLLRAMITAVLEPASPIDELTVLNPEIPSDLADEKTIVLDLRVRCDDGTQFDLEMESEPRQVFRPRLVFYWARLHASQLSRGESYATLARTVSIAWLGGTVLPSDRFHSTFRILEERSHHCLSDELEIHVLELPKREADVTLSPALRRWADFFASPTEDTLARIADEDAIMSDAVKALGKVSGTPEARALAEERLLRKWNAKLEAQHAERELERAEQRGHEAGRIKERAKQQRTFVERLLARGMSTDEVAELVGITPAEVEALRQAR